MDERKLRHVDIYSFTGGKSARWAAVCPACTKGFERDRRSATLAEKGQSMSNRTKTRSEAKAEAPTPGAKPARAEGQ